VVSIVPAAGVVVAMVASIAFGGAALNALVAIDWSQPSAYLVLEVFRRVLAVGLLCVGLIAATARGRRDHELDDRPAPWLLGALLVALGVFFIYNLVDFVMAEPGPLTLFAVLLGAALGLRTPSVAGQRPRRGTAIGFLAAGAVAWLACVFGVLLPIATAEDQAARGDDALRNDRPDLAAGLYRSAYQTVPYNADYAYRSAAALMRAGASPEQVLAMLGVAVATDPSSVLYYSTRAGYLLHLPAPDAQAIRSDFERALKLDPNNVSLRLDDAQALETLGNPAAAAQQYRDALARNDRLNPDEPKRLPPEKVEQIRERARQLEATAATRPSR
jgi:tetratricopeptide (TPR) repeat protein